MPNVNNFAVLTAAAKKAAREELRSKAYLAVTAALYRIKQAFTKDIDSLKKEAESAEKETRVLEVEAREMAADHPEKADFVKDAEKARKETDERKAAIEKEITELTAANQKEVTEKEAELKAIETGEDKVKYEEVVARASKLLTLRIRSQHDAGDFDTQETA